MAPGIFKQNEAFAELIIYIQGSLTSENVKDLLVELHENETINTIWEKYSSDGQCLIEKMKQVDIYNKEKMEPLVKYMRAIERIDLAKRIEEFYIERLNESKFARNVNNIDSPVSYFFERCEVKVLEQSLQEKKVVLLTGPPGSGKTQLAQNYAESIKLPSEQEFNVHWKVSSKNEDEMMSSLDQLADALKLTRVDSYGAQDKSKVIKSLINDIFQKLSSQNHEHLLLFDNLNDAGLFDIVMKKFGKFEHQHIKLIFTSTNKHVANASIKVHHSEIKGFSSDETLSFFGQNSRLREYFEDKEIITLAEQLDFLPLGLVSAKAYLKMCKCTPAAYITLLTNLSTWQAFVESEKSSGVIGSYGTTLLKAMMLSIVKFKELLAGNAEAYAMFEMVCLFNHQNIPMSILSTGLTNATKDVTENLLISHLGLLHMGTVSVMNGFRYLTIHQSLQHAARLLWSSNSQRIQASVKGLFLLLKYFEKDTRFIKEFGTTKSLVPHVIAALTYTELFLVPEKFHKSDVAYKKALVARILLLDVLGYVYSQIGLNAQSEEPLRKAKDILYTLADIRDTDDAKSMYEKLSKLSCSLTQSEVLSIVLNRNLTDQDVTVVNSKLEGGTKVSMQLNREDYGRLVQSKAAIKESVLCKMFLPEVMVSVLYSHGRTYFYIKDQCNKDFEKKSSFVKDMCMARDLSGAIHADCECYILHEMLSQRNALLYLNLEEVDTHGKNKLADDFKTDLMKALQTYKRLAHDENDYYQFGILKTTKDDLYGKMICLRQMLQCYKKLHKIAPHPELVAETRTHVTDMLKLADQLKNKSALLPNIYNTAAEIELMSNTLDGHKKALEYYETSCKYQKDNDQKNYGLLYALFGMANVKMLLAEGKPSSPLLPEARKHLQEVIELVQEMWPSNDKSESSEVKKAKDMLRTIDDLTPGYNDEGRIVSQPLQ